MAVAVKIAIDVVDRSGAAASKLSERLTRFNAEASRVREPFEKLHASYGRFLKLTGVDAVAGGLASVGRAGYSAFQSIARIVEPLGVIAGAASIAGMMRLATSWAEFGTQLGQTAARAGLSVTQMQRLENAGRLAGVSAQAVSGGMIALKDNLTDYAGGRASADFIGMTQALQVNLRDAAGQVRTTTDLLPEFADKIAGLENPTLQARAATALFGAAGEEMLPFLREGSKGMAEYNAIAERYGLMNEAGVAAANDLRKAQTRLHLAVDGLGYSISERLSPILAPLLTQMAEWIAANRDWISSGIADAVGRFASYVKSIDWVTVGTDIEAIGQKVNDVVRFVGGWQTAGEIALAFFAVPFLAKMLGPIAIITTALMRLPGLTATAAAKSEAALGRTGLLGRLAGAASGGLIAHEGMQAADPNDAMGAWIDRNIPGASFVDNMASHLGIGRSYQDQAEVNARLGHGPGAPAAPALPGGHAPQETSPPPAPSGQAAQAVDIARTQMGEGPQQVQPYIQAGGGGVNAATSAWCAAFVNSSLAQAGVDGSHSAIATSFLNWGRAVDANAAAKGDVVVAANGHRAFETGGHVGMATGEHRVDPRTGHEQLQVVQGNWGNRVATDWKDASTLNVRRAEAPAPAGPDLALPATAGTAKYPDGKPDSAMPNGRVDINAVIPPAAAAVAAATYLATHPLLVKTSPVGFDRRDH